MEKSAAYCEKCSRQEDSSQDGDNLHSGAVALASLGELPGFLGNFYVQAAIILSDEVVQLRN